MQNEAGYLVDMHGAIDMHFHPAPCLFPRLATDREIAVAADAVGMGGLLLKCHHESTVSRARALRKDLPADVYIRWDCSQQLCGRDQPKSRRSRA